MQAAGTIIVVIKLLIVARGKTGVESAEGEVERGWTMSTPDEKKLKLGNLEVKLPKEETIVETVQ